MVKLRGLLSSMVHEEPTHLASALGTGPLDLLAQLAPTPPAAVRPEQPPVWPGLNRRVAAAALRGSAESDLRAADRLAALDVPAEVDAWPTLVTGFLLERAPA